MSISRTPAKVRTYKGAIKDLIDFTATAPTVHHLETMFDVVAGLPWDDETKKELDLKIFNLITNHKAYW